MNRLSFSSSGNPIPFYAALTAEERRSINRAFDYTQDFPYEHGDVIIRKLADPITWYEFDDGQWRILYTMESMSDTPLSKEISVFAVGYA